MEQMHKIIPGGGEGAGGTRWIWRTGWNPLQTRSACGAAESKERLMVSLLQGRPDTFAEPLKSGESAEQVGEVMNSWAATLSEASMAVSFEPPSPL